MPVKTKRKHKMTRSQRIERACLLFSRGYTDSDVARDLPVSRNTAHAYRVIYEARLKEHVNENPRFLHDIIGNTRRQIEELEEVRRAMWRDYEDAKTGIEIECENCEEVMVIPIASMTTRNSIMANIIKAQDQRAKLYGVLGVKAEFFAMVAGVKALQDALLAFMSAELCPEDRVKLERYLDTPEISQYLNTPTAAITASSWEDVDEAV